jgi:hypothetical protein
MHQITPLLPLQAEKDESDLLYSANNAEIVDDDDEAEAEDDDDDGDDGLPA